MRTHAPVASKRTQHRAAVAVQMALAIDWIACARHVVNCRPSPAMARPGWHGWSVNPGARWDGGRRVVARNSRFLK